MAPARTKKRPSTALSSHTFKKNLILIGGMTFLGVVVSVGTIYYAQRNGGQINVAAAIAQSNRDFNERVARGENIEDIDKPRPNANTNAKKPNGGLVGTGKPTPAPQPEVQGTSTATSTAETSEDTASTTTEVASEDTLASESDGTSPVIEEAHGDEADPVPVVEETTSPEDTPTE